MPASVVYKILTAGSAEEMERLLNDAAGEGWFLNTLLANQFGSTTVAHALMERKLTAKEMK
jgi:hypothetical protein